MTAPVRSTCATQIEPLRSAVMTAATISVGDLLPEVELLDETGRPWLTAERRGRPLVLILHRHLA